MNFVPAPTSPCLPYHPHGHPFHRLDRRAGLHACPCRLRAGPIACRCPDERSARRAVSSLPRSNDVRRGRWATKKNQCIVCSVVFSGIFSEETHKSDTYPSSEGFRDGISAVEDHKTKVGNLTAPVLPVDSHVYHFAIF